MMTQAHNDRLYTYSPLPPNSIRLLRLHPAPIDSPISCELHTARVEELENDPVPFVRAKYEAVSYVWGEVNGQTLREIECHGRAMKVTPNLHDALTQLCQRTERRTLWIDAVCINQGDNIEKSQQLGFMRAIYYRASRVIIWLGKVEQDSEQAIDLVHRMAAADRDRATPPALPSYTDESAWEPLVRLVTNSWFTRIWIYQESALAQSAIIHIGSLQIAWEDLWAAVNFFASIRVKRPVRLTKPCVAVWSLCSWSRVVSRQDEFRPIPLRDLLWSTTYFKATLPHDRVYALLGLAREANDYEPDYSQPLKDLYTSVTLKMLQKPGIPDALGILASVKHYHNPPNDFPSWVNKWDNKVPEAKQIRTAADIQPMYIIYGLPASRSFCAGGPDYPGPQLDPTKPYAVRLQGFEVDTIVRAVNFLTVSPLQRDCLWDMVLDIKAVCPPFDAEYIGGGSVEDALAMTFTLGEPKAGISLRLGTALLNVGPGADTFRAVDFQHFCMTLFEQAVARLEMQGRRGDADVLRGRWSGEYDRLRRTVGTHVKSPRFSGELQTTCLGRKVFCTARGYVGIGDVTLQPGDRVCVLLGGKIPFVLRPAGNGFRFVGECYVQGIMYGETMTQEGRVDKWFELW